MSDAIPSRAAILDDGDVQLYHGDVIQTLRELPAGIAQTCVTSPPYWGLRDYGTGGGQIGLEETPDLYVERMVAVFREVWRVLRDDGTVWLNLGDSYASSPPGNTTKGVSGASTLNGIASDRYRETQPPDPKPSSTRSSGRAPQPSSLATTPGAASASTSQPNTSPSRLGGCSSSACSRILLDVLRTLHDRQAAFLHH